MEYLSFGHFCPKVTNFDCFQINRVNSRGVFKTFLTGVNDSLQIAHLKDRATSGTDVWNYYVSQFHAFYAVLIARNYKMQIIYSVAAAVNEYRIYRLFFHTNDKC